MDFDVTGIIIIIPVTPKSTKVYTLEIPYNKKLEHRRNLQKIQRFQFERASFRSSGGRGVDRLLVMGRRDALVKGRPCYRESRYRESRVYLLINNL